MNLRDKIEILNTNKKVKLWGKPKTFSATSNTKYLETTHVPYGEMYETSLLLRQRFVLSNEQTTMYSLAKENSIKSILYFLYGDILEDLRSIRSAVYNRDADEALFYCDKIDKDIGI